MVSGRRLRLFQPLNLRSGLNLNLDRNARCDGSDRLATGCCCKQSISGFRELMFGLTDFDDQLRRPPLVVPGDRKAKPQKKNENQMHQETDGPTDHPLLPTRLTPMIATGFASGRLEFVAAVNDCWKRLSFDSRGSRQRTYRHWKYDPSDVRVTKTHGMRGHGPTFSEIPHLLNRRFIPIIARKNNPCRREKRRKNEKSRLSTLL